MKLNSNKFNFSSLFLVKNPATEFEEFEPRLKYCWFTQDCKKKIQDLSRCGVTFRSLLKNGHSLCAK